MKPSPGLDQTDLASHSTNQLWNAFKIFYILEMNSQHFSTGMNQRFVVSQSLRPDESTERQTFGRDIKICCRLGGDNNEQPIAGSPFVELSRRMLEARTKACGHRVACLGTHGNPHLL